MAIEADAGYRAAERREKTRFTDYDAPAGGWGSAKSLMRSLGRERDVFSGPLLLSHQNKPDGFTCVSCAWAKPDDPHIFEFCENGAKATTWEVTTRRAEPEFFAAHTVTELETWPDHDLEELGRLTRPMRWDAASDRYLPVAWDDAFREIGQEIRALDPDAVVFYASGRAALETSYMYQLFARMVGTNNLPDSSNMCHETTSVALRESIGDPVGTVTLEDFRKADCIFFFGQNVGSNSPRMLHDLQAASQRGVPIVTFNPLRERGLVAFTNPQSPAEMLSGSQTRISSQYHQVKAGGDLAAIMGICKALIAADDAALRTGGPRVLDADFIADHTSGFEAFAETARTSDWADIERGSGLTRGALEAAAAVYAAADRTIGIYGMGLTQHRNGVETVQMVVNLLLLRGNIGKPGAGVCPVRGHSNVQGQRTVGITEKPELAPLDTLAKLYNFEPPRKKGFNTVEACEAIIAGDVKAFIGLGGNFIRAVPETEAMEAAWRKLRLTVQIATKPNRNHVIHGQVSYVLPCLGRIEIDRQPSGQQSVTTEDSTACVHGSRGMAPPASPDLLSEARIVAEMAKAALGSASGVDWDGWADDYSRVRDAIARTYPEDFHDLNTRMGRPGGFHRNIAARERRWKTAIGKALFITPRTLAEDPDVAEDRRDLLRLITLRSNDQFNTTIYGYDDRFRGVRGTRMIVLMNRNDIDRMALKEGDIVNLTTEAGDGLHREVAGLRVTGYDIPEGCAGGYYPECNPLIPLWHHAERSKVPAAKSIPVRVRKAAPDSDIGAIRKLSPTAGDVIANVAADAGVAGRAGVALGLRIIRKNPWRAAMVAIGLGLLAGLALPRRRR